MKKIAIDAFGGDHAPGEIVKGCVDALKEFDDIVLLLTGDETALNQELSKYKVDLSRVEIHHAPGIITNCEAPVLAVRRKKDSSLVKALELVAEKHADVFISAGSTGAVLAGATFIVKRIKGIKRPALAPVLPTAKGGVVLVDCGANVDCKPINLQQFAIMGSVYAEHVMGIKSPRVGLINNGAESEKGCELTKETYKLLLDTPHINFLGNIEGRDIVSGDFDVAVADGFVGNVVLKFMEGLSKTMISMLKVEFKKGILAQIGALLLMPKLKSFKKKMDYTEYGGALLLGIEAGIIKAHGSSNARAIYSTINQARNFISGNVVDVIRRSIEALPQEE